MASILLLVFLIPSRLDNNMSDLFECLLVLNGQRKRRIKSLRSPESCSSRASLLPWRSRLCRFFWYRRISAQDVEKHNCQVTLVSPVSSKNNATIKNREEDGKLRKCSVEFSVSFCICELELLSEVAMCPCYPTNFHSVACDSLT